MASPSLVSIHYVTEYILMDKYIIDKYKSKYSLIYFKEILYEIRRETMINEVKHKVREEHGLTDNQVKNRQDKFGQNTIQKKKRISPLRIFVEQFNDVIIWVLIAATIISGLFGDKADAITIIIIVFMNAILGFVQEFRTERALEALKTLSAPTCKVIRNRNIMVINSEELVPDDIVILESGD